MIQKQKKLILWLKIDFSTVVPRFNRILGARCTDIRIVSAKGRAFPYSVWAKRRVLRTGKFRRYQILLSATYPRIYCSTSRQRRESQDLPLGIPFRIAPCLSIPRYGQDTWSPSSIICPPSRFPCNQNTSLDR